MSVSVEPSDDGFLTLARMSLAAAHRRTFTFHDVRDYPKTYALKVPARNLSDVRIDLPPPPLRKA